LSGEQEEMNQKVSIVWLTRLRNMNTKLQMQIPENRNWIIPIVIGAVICSVMIACVTILVAELEFHSAVWTFQNIRSPWITNLYRSFYWAGLSLPILTGLVGFLSIVRKHLGKTSVAWCASVLAVMHLGWLLFCILAIYLANQNFVA
jgi:hypothetical protein